MVQVREQEGDPIQPATAGHPRLRSHHRKPFGPGCTQPSPTARRQQPRGIRRTVALGPEERNAIRWQCAGGVGISASLDRPDLSTQAAHRAVLGRRCTYRSHAAEAPLVVDPLAVIDVRSRYKHAQHVQCDLGRFAVWYLRCRGGCWTMLVAPVRRAPVPRQSASKSRSWASDERDSGPDDDTHSEGSDELAGPGQPGVRQAPPDTGVAENRDDAFANAECWSKLIPSLTAKGFPVVAANCR
jgi:hypothetical protein